jgi:bacterioferritin-associated ferredoxin
MIVCSCNVLSDHAVRNVVTASREQPLSAQQVYDCLGCSVQCGRCARGVKRIITEASTACVERAAEGFGWLTLKKPGQYTLLARTKDASGRGGPTLFAGSAPSARRDQEQNNMR